MPSKKGLDNLFGLCRELAQTAAENLHSLQHDLSQPEIPPEDEQNALMQSSQQRIVRLLICVHDELSQMSQRIRR